MRVMQLTTDLAFAGAERVIVNLARCLALRGVECCVAGLMEGGDGAHSIRQPLAEAGIEVYPAGLGSWNAPAGLAGLLRHVRRWRPDVLHAHLYHAHAASVLLRAAGLRCRVIWTHHTVEWRRVSFRRAFYRLVSGWPDAKVYVSHAVGRYQRAVAGPGQREELIYNGIDLAPFLSVERTPGAVFGAIGRLVPEKGYDALLRAFGRLCGEDDRVTLRIAGSGPMEAELRDMIRREGLEGRVEMVGFAEDVPDFLAGVNVFVHPSLMEGFGLTLLEALASGLPCIASPVGALPEIGGDCVRWVRPADVDDLHRAMCEALSTAHSPEAVARQRQRIGRFSREAMADSYLKLYHSLLRGRRP